MSILNAICDILVCIVVVCFYVFCCILVCIVVYLFGSISLQYVIHFAANMDEIKMCFLFQGQAVPQEEAFREGADEEDVSVTIRIIP